jgi:anaerobic ribonucleoside-triphosphate reductase
VFQIGKPLEPAFVELINSFPCEILKLNGISEIDPFILAEEYYQTENVADVSIDPNANISGKSPVNFTLEIFKPILKLRSMNTAWKMIKERWGIQQANECLTACLNGKLYHHDWTKYDVPYCFAPDSTFWMTQGRPYGWLPGGVPNKLQSFIGQTVEVAMDMSQENAGAIGIANVLVNAAFYCYHDRNQVKMGVEFLKDNTDLCNEDIIYVIARFYSHNEEDFEKKVQKATDIYYRQGGTWYACVEAVMSFYDKYVEDLLQHLVHVLHNTFRIGGDSPFTNLSLFCRKTIEKFFEDALYPDMSSPVDIIDEIMHIQFLFAKFFAEGSPLTGKNYRFPICTVNLAVKDWESFTDCEKERYPNKKCLILDREFFYKICRLNARRGTFNYHKGEKLASCCRLTSDLKELINQIKTDTFGNGGMSIGSHRVVACNHHSIACEAIDTGKSFEDVLYKYQGYAEMLLLVHKQWLKKVIDTRTLKFFRIGWADLNMFFSTFGFVGLWDAYDLLDENTDDRTEFSQYFKETYHEFAKSTLNQMERVAKTCGQMWEGYAFNVEEVPAENASPKLAKIDNFYYGDRPWYKKVELLSNQMIPVYVDIDPFERLQSMGELMNIVSGGAICHFNIDGSMTEQASIKLTEYIIEECNIPHFAIEIGTTTCIKGHTSVGVHPQCPECNGEIDTWTRRVVGFNSDTKDWASARRDFENMRRVRYGVHNL